MLFHTCFIHLQDGLMQCFCQSTCHHFLHFSLWKVALHDIVWLCLKKMPAPISTRDLRLSDWNHNSNDVSLCVWCTASSSIAWESGITMDTRVWGSLRLWAESSQLGSHTHHCINYMTVFEKTRCNIMINAQLSQCRECIDLIRIFC